MVEAFIKDYHPSSWLTMVGVRRKRSEIEKRGVPDLKGCMFFTLTIDPRIGSESETYDLGKDRLRRFLDSLRVYWGETSTVCLLDEKGLPILRKDGSVKTRSHTNRYSFGWAWKLEFQGNGYAHWHLLVKTNRRINKKDLPLLNEFWGLGRTNVEKIKNADFDYLFKYVSKCPAHTQSDSSGLALPDWVLDYKRHGKDGKPMMRIRFWQTRNFYEPKDDGSSGDEDGGISFRRQERDEFGKDCFLYDPCEEPKSEHVQQYSIVRYTIREFVGIQDRVGLLLVRTTNSIKFSAKIYFDGSWVQSRQALINEAVNIRKPMRFGKYPIFEDIIHNQSKIWRMKLEKILLQTQSALAMA